MRLGYLIKYPDPILNKNPFVPSFLLAKMNFLFLALLLSPVVLGNKISKVLPSYVQANSDRLSYLEIHFPTVEKEPLN
jgi:hypothetical protein